MSERDFFSDTVTEDEEDDFLRDALDDGGSEGVEESTPDDVDLSDDSESDEDDDLDDDSDDEDEDLDDETEDDSEAEEDDLPTPSTDFEGWLDTLEDDERGVVESLVAQASESTNLQTALKGLAGKAQEEILTRDLTIRHMEQMIRVMQIAVKDPQGFPAFQQRFQTAQQQRALMAQKMANDPARRELEQIKSGFRQWVVGTAEREQREGLMDHVRAGKPLTMDDGSKIAFKQLSALEDELLSRARTPQEFDAALYKIQATRQQSTERARETLRENRTRNGSDKAGVRSSGGHGGTRKNYDNYNPENFDSYMDDVLSGAARG